MGGLGEVRERLLGGDEGLSPKDFVEVVDRLHALELQVASLGRMCAMLEDRVVSVEGESEESE